jgi:transposase-like protein
MSVLRCKHCDFVVESYLAMDGSFVCEDCLRKFKELQRNTIQQIEELQREDFLVDNIMEKS